VENWVYSGSTSNCNLYVTNVSYSLLQSSQVYVWYKQLDDYALRTDMVFVDGRQVLSLKNLKPVGGNTPSSFFIHHETLKKEQASD